MIPPGFLCPKRFLTPYPFLPAPQVKVLRALEALSPVSALPSVSPAPATQPVCASGFHQLFTPAVSLSHCSEVCLDTSGFLQALLSASQPSARSLGRILRWDQDGPLPGAPAHSNPSCQILGLLKVRLISPLDQCAFSLFPPLPGDKRSRGFLPLLSIAQLFLDFH